LWADGAWAGVDGLATAVKPTPAVHLLPARHQAVALR
jgi:hypothetical protein